MLVAPYATKTIVGHADSQYAAAFCVLAFSLLGMDRRGSGFRVSLRRGFFNAVASNPRRQSPRRLNRPSGRKEWRARISPEIALLRELEHDEWPSVSDRIRRDRIK